MRVRQCGRAREYDHTYARMRALTESETIVDVDVTER